MNLQILKTQILDFSQPNALSFELKEHWSQFIFFVRRENLPWTKINFIVLDQF